MKKLYFGLLFTLSFLAFLFVMGVFNPKRIYLDEMEISAPDGMIVSSVTIDYIKNTQNRFSPVFFKNKTEYSLSDHKEVSILFSKSNRLHNIADIRVNVTPSLMINNFNKRIADKVKLKREENKKCLIYQSVDNKDDIVDFDIFIRHTKTMVLILSYNKHGAEYILKQICS